ncbi:hypothetical protein V3C99_015954, partial [Haemonchus contortus]
SCFLYAIVGFMLLTQTANRKCSTYNGTKEYEICELIVDFLRNTCEVKDFHFSGRLKIREEDLGCAIMETVMGITEVTRMACSCRSEDFCAEKMENFEVFETKNESGVNYTKCLREAFKKGAFLSPRLFETGDANNGSSVDEASNSTMTSSQTDGQVEEIIKDYATDSQHSTSHRRKIFLTAVITISGVMLFITTVVLVALSYPAFFEDMHKN